MCAYEAHIGVAASLPLRDTREAALGAWHRRMLMLVDDVLKPEGSGVEPEHSEG